MLRPAPSRALARGFVCALLVLAAPAAQAALTAPLRLEWTAPAGCPGAAEVRELVAGVLGRPLESGGPDATRVRARVVTIDGGYALTIETRSASGTNTRRMQDPRCSVLAEAAAVIAATAVDPSLAPPSLPPAEPAIATDLSAGTGTGLVPLAPGVPGSEDMSFGTDGSIAPPERPVAGQVPAAPIVRVAGSAPVFASREPEPEPAPRPAAARKPRLRGALRFAGVADLGSVLEATGGLTWAAALLGRLWRVELSGLWLAPRTSRPDPTREVGARVGLLAAALRGCLTPTMGRLEIPLCGGLEVGALRGVGVGIGDAASDALPWLAVNAGPGLMFAPIPRLALTLQVDLVVPTLPAVFEVGGYGEVYRGGRAAARAALGIEVRFR